MLTVHHLVVDGWSFGLLLDDLFQLYAAETAGGTSPPVTSTHYFDFVRWQSNMLASAEGTRLRRYWEGELAGELPVLNLPTDRPRLAVVGLRGASVGFSLDAELTASVKHLAAAGGTTPFVVLLAALQVLLGRYTGQTDVLVGSPVAGRGRAAFERLIGNCMNMVVLRGDLSDDPSFRVFVARLRRRVLDALAHQDYPFPLLIEGLKAGRDLSRMPVFQVTFNYLRLQTETGVAALVAQDAGDTTIEIGGLRLQCYPVSQQEGQVDLALEITEIGSRLRGRLKYDSALFDASTVEAMTSHFQAILRAALEAPERSIGQLSLFIEVERHQILREKHHTDHPSGPRPQRRSLEAVPQYRLVRTHEPHAERGQQGGEIPDMQVELEKIENVLRRHPGVAEAVIVPADASPVTSSSRISCRPRCHHPPPRPCCAGSRAVPRCWHDAARVCPERRATVDLRWDCRSPRIARSDRSAAHGG